MKENILIDNQNDDSIKTEDREFKNHDHAKDEIIKLAEGLTNQSELTENITLKISEFNSFLTPISEKILSINKKDNLLKMALLVNFSKKTEEIEQKILTYNTEFNSFKNKITECIESYSLVIQLIESLQSEINPVSKFYKNSLGIVAFNKMRIEDMNNKILHINSCLETIENFKTSTLYHLKESMGQGLANKRTHQLIETGLELLQKIINQTQTKIYISKIGVAIAAILFSYNYITSKYYIKYHTSENIYASEFSKATEAAKGMGGAMVDLESTMSGVISALSILIAFPVFFMAYQKLIRGNTVGFMALMIFSVIFCGGLLMLSETFDSNEPEIQYSVEVIKTIEFYNFGSLGNIFLLATCVFILIYSIFKKYQLKKQKNYQSNIKNLIS